MGRDVRRGDSYDPVGYEPWSGGGAHILRAQLQGSLTPDDDFVEAKIYAWVHADEDLGVKEVTVKVYDPTKKVTIAFDEEDEEAEKPIVWIIRRPDAKGEEFFGRWELLSFPDGGWQLGKADNAISVGAEGTVSVWSGPGGAEVDTGKNVQAWAIFGAIASGAWVGVQTDRSSGTKYATETRCPS